MKYHITIIAESTEEFKQISDAFILKDKVSVLQTLDGQIKELEIRKNDLERLVNKLEEHFREESTKHSLIPSMDD